MTDDSRALEIPHRRPDSWHPSLVPSPLHTGIIIFEQPAPLLFHATKNCWRDQSLRLTYEHLVVLLIFLSGGLPASVCVPRTIICQRRTF